MKKHLFLVIFVSVATSLFSQKFYVRLNLGSGTGIQGVYYQGNSHYTITDIYDSVTSYSVHEAYKLSMGKGLRYGGSIGLKINQIIMVELGVEYFNSKPNSIVTEEFYYFYDIYEVKYKNYLNISGRLCQVIPSITFQKDNNVLSPYFKLGGIIGMASMLEDEDLRITNSIPGYYPTESYKSEFEYESELSFGFTSSVGSDFLLIDGVYLFAELKYSNLYYVPSKGSYTKYEYRGNDILQTLTDQQRYYEFVDKYDSRENENQEEVTKVLESKYSFNNISVLAGLRINLYPTKKE